MKGERSLKAITVAEIRSSETLSKADLAEEIKRGST